ncbi:10764_t:CDS:1, partial [Acaulospora colombiana]
DDNSVKEAVERRKELLDSITSFQTLSGVGYIGTNSYKFYTLKYSYRPIKAQQFAEKNGWKTSEDIIKDKAFKKLSKRIQTALQFSSKTLDQVSHEDVEKVITSIASILKDFEVYGTGSLYDYLCPKWAKLTRRLIVEEVHLTHQRSRYYCFTPGSKQHSLQSNVYTLKGHGVL